MKDDDKSLNYQDFFINYEGIFRVEQIDMVDDLDSFIITPAEDSHLYRW